MGTLVLPKVDFLGQWFYSMWITVAVLLYLVVLWLLHLLKKDCMVTSDPILWHFILIDAYLHPNRPSRRNEQMCMARI